MKILRGVFLVCIFAGFAALFFVLDPSQKPMQEGEEGARWDTKEDILLEGLRFSEWEEGRRNWSMDAERSWYDYDEQKATLEQVVVTFLPPTGGKLLMWAERLDYDLETRKLLASGSVRGKSDQGYDFSTESLSYDSDARLVRTADKVTLAKDRLTIQGKGMEGSLADHRFTLLSAVQAVFVPQGFFPRGTDSR